MVAKSILYKTYMTIYLSFSYTFKRHNYFSALNEYIAKLYKKNMIFNKTSLFSARIISIGLFNLWKQLMYLIAYKVLYSNICLKSHLQRKTVDAANAYICKVSVNKCSNIYVITYYLCTWRQRSILMLH